MTLKELRNTAYNVIHEYNIDVRIPQKDGTIHTLRTERDNSRNHSWEVIGEALENAERYAWEDFDDEDLRIHRHPYEVIQEIIRPELVKRLEQAAQTEEFKYYHQNSEATIYVEDEEVITFNHDGNNCEPEYAPLSMLGAGINEVLKEKKKDRDRALRQETLHPTKPVEKTTGTERSPALGSGEPLLSKRLRTALIMKESGKLHRDIAKKLKISEGTSISLVQISKNLLKPSDHWTHGLSDKATNELWKKKLNSTEKLEAALKQGILPPPVHQEIVAWKNLDVNAIIKKEQNHIDKEVAKRTHQMEI